MADTFGQESARSLSPITELTTPGSFRTLPLPNFDARDYYTSEREQTPSPDHSVRSHQSGDTITLRLPRTTLSPTTEQPPRSNRSSARPSPIPIPSRQRTYPFPDDASPGGLLPPPRPGTSASTPPASPSPYGPVSDEARRRYAERYRLSPVTSPGPASSPIGNPNADSSNELAQSNLAGVGTGDACRTETAPERPNSFHAAPRSTSALSSQDLVSAVTCYINKPLTSGVC